MEFPADDHAEAAGVFQLYAHAVEAVSRVLAQNLAAAGHVVILGNVNVRRVIGARGIGVAPRAGDGIQREFAVLPRRQRRIEAGQPPVLRARAQKGVVVAQKQRVGERELGGFARAYVARHAQKAFVVALHCPFGRFAVYRDGRKRQPRRGVAVRKRRKQCLVVVGQGAFAAEHVSVHGEQRVFQRVAGAVFKGNRLRDGERLAVLQHDHGKLVTHGGIRFRRRANECRRCGAHKRREKSAKHTHHQ